MAIYVNGIRRDGAGNDGKRPIEFDFSSIEQNTFTEKIDGDILLTYTVTRDASDEIISIADPNQDVTQIAWPAYPATYDEYSFLAGICIGRSMKGVTIVNGISIEEAY